MDEINQDKINNFTTYLKKDKFKNKILNLNLEYCNTDKDSYLIIQQFKIKQSQRKLGYGSMVLYNLIKFADSHNVRIIGETDFNLKWLHSFFIRQGFVLNKNDKKYILTYFPTT